MERYKVTLAYDGTLFYGFQRQGSTRTVQLELEAALRRLNWQGRAILSSGRTDTGVHAEGQVVAFDLEWTHGTDQLLRAMNAHLPDDVAVKQVEVADPDFHPRFDATSRCYHYQVLFAPVRDPLRDRYTWRVWPPCEVERLQAAAQLLHGTHDYAAFGAPPKPNGSTIRTVFKAGWQSTGEKANVVRFEVIANAFLYHMVRRMTYLQVLVGQERLSLNALQEALDRQTPLTPGLASPQGLSLMEVRYEGIPYHRRGQVTLD